MEKVTVVNVVMSSILVVYSLFLLQIHVFLVVGPVLMLAPWYLPFEILAICGLVGWSFYMFGFWFVALLDKRVEN